MDYDSLRRDGIEQLEKLTGESEQWTDFNEHDPGITILEQVCYALTDLSYRTGYEIPDLLATGGGAPYGSLYPPAKILSSRAVTSLDLRKVALDVPWVRDVWVTLALDVKATRPPVLQPPFPDLKGLHRILIDVRPQLDTKRAEIEESVALAVAERLHENRNVGEDFAEIRVVDLQWVHVDCTVEVDPVDDAGAVRKEILRRLEEHIAPNIRFATAAQWWNEGRPADEIFDGPVLDQRFGEKRFIDSDALRAAERPAAIYTAKVIRVISEVPHVRAVTDISLTSSPESVLPLGQNATPWVLPLDPTLCARLDPSSPIKLRRNGVPVGETALAALRDPRGAGSLAAHDEAAPVDAGVDPFAPPPFRERHVSRYHTVQNQFPRVYGIGEAGLPDGATALRRAQAKQLMGYLMFFDQPMANYLAQLAHLRDLLSFEATPQTYFVQPVNAPGADAPPAPLETPARRNRFLDHLLARFAEELMDDHLVPKPTEPANKVAEDKVAFLKAYPRISAARGTASNVLKDPGADNRSGLEERIARRLGLDAKSAEKLVLVEHILLRHFTGEIAPFVLPRSADPYSLQVTFVLQTGEGLFEKGNRITERTLREETPAHLVVYVQWVDPSEWSQFEIARKAWLKARKDLGPFAPDQPGA